MYFIGRLIITICLFLLALFFVSPVYASEGLKLPYIKGESMVVTRGYNTPPTHASDKKDALALDFTKNGCEGYGKSHVAIQDGVLEFMNTLDEYGGGYGLNVIVNHGDGLISRYAHLSDYAKGLSIGDVIKQGQLLGYQGKTGNVIGVVCAQYPGTHLHLVMLKNRQPYKPEPMSGYTNFTAGQWYTSDNELYDPTSPPPEPEPQTASQPQTQPKVSLWSKILNFFSSLFASESEEAKSEEVQGIGIASDIKIPPSPPLTGGEITNTPLNPPQGGNTEGNYNLQFLNSGQSLVAEPGEVLNLKVEIKNTGTAVWKKQNISANVVGGQTVNNVYYHSSWVTKLRPAVLNENEVAPGGTGIFSFFINTPSASGDYNFQIQAVRVDNNFSYIQGGVWSVNLKVVTEPAKILPASPVGRPNPPLEKEGMTGEEETVPVNENPKNIIEKTVEAIKEVAEKTVEKTVEIFQQVFSYGGGSTNPNNQNTNNNQEESEEQPEEIVEIPDETPTSTPEIDTTPPEIPVVSIYQSEFATPTLFISWYSAEADNYDVQYKIDEGEWLDFVTSTTSTNSEIITERWQNYFFRARAYDEAGNISEWSDEQSFIPDWPRTVVINEVAWMGTGKISNAVLNCPKNEWLELYNNSEQEIDLTGWKLKINNQIINLSGIIPAQDYYVIAKKVGTRIALLLPTPDLIWSNINIEIPDNGGRLLLVDAENNIIDEINSPDSWFAGENIDKFYSMARIDSRLPGSVSTNWEATKFLRNKIQSNSCGTVYGTPGQTNRGQWFLSGLMANYSEHWDENNVLNLTAENGPYVFDIILEIPVGHTLRAEAGTIFYGRNKDAYFKVLGNLEFLGEAENPIIITSARDNNYVANNLSELPDGEPLPGDWSRIEVQPGGNLKAEHAKFFYGGRRFYQSSGWVYGTFPSSVIRNIGGEVVLDKTVFNFSYLETKADHQPYSALVWTEAPNGYNATTIIDNSLLSGGWMAFKNYRQDNGQKINFSLKNSRLENFQSSDGSLVSARDFPILENNVFIDNAQSHISFDTWILTTSTILSPGVDYSFGRIHIPAGLSLTVNPGVNLLMRVGNITVDGDLNFLGEFDNVVTIRSFDSYGWGKIILNNTNSVWRFVNLRGGNLNTDRDKGVVTAYDSVLDFSQVSFTNVGRPYNALYLENSTTTIRDSAIVWSTQYTGSNTVYGIKLNSGNLLLDGVNFNNMGVGVGILNEGKVEMINMTEDNFQNIRFYNWQPQEAWNFDSSFNS